MGSLPIGEFRIFQGFCDGSDFGNGGGLVSSSLVLDGERGELVRAPVRMGKKGGGGGGGGVVVSEVRAAMALKSHSEAERRRRERINSHLSTLRSLVPTTSKMDKAALLAEVISQLKELKNKATEISKRCIVPSDTDEVRVEPCGDEINDGGFLIKASLCCEDRPDLIADLKQTLQSLHLKTVSAEISTLGGRVKNVFVMTSEGNTSDREKNIITSSLHQALKAIMDRVSSQTDFAPKTSLPGKRRRIIPFESSSSSS